MSIQFVDRESIPACGGRQRYLRSTDGRNHTVSVTVNSVPNPGGFPYNQSYNATPAGVSVGPTCARSDVGIQTFTYNAVELDGAPVEISDANTVDEAF